MRGGYFLAEESPERLMSQFNADSLEDVFLKLSVIQNMGKRRRSSILQSVTDTIHVPELPGGAVNEAVVLNDELGEISGEFGDNISNCSRVGSKFLPFIIDMNYITFSKIYFFQEESLLPQNLQ